MGKIVVGRWDCSYCGTKGIRGSERECPNCGRPRGEDVKFYVDDPKDYVPEDEATKISKEPDWMCEFCGSYNSAKLTKCMSCGAERGKSKDYFQVQEENREKESEKAKNTENEFEPKPEKVESYQNFESQQEDYSQRDFSSYNLANIFLNKKVIAIVLAVLFSIIGVVFLFTPKEANMQITDFSWSRSISIEQNRTFHESDWSVPAGGRVTSQQMEFHHYQSVLDHYETRTREVARERLSHYEYSTTLIDMGNGYFEEETISTPVYETYYETEEYQEPIYRDEPVYAMKYYYDIDRYVYERPVNTSGNDKEPYWGEVKLNYDERVSERNEEYKVSGITDEKEKRTLEISVNFEKWNVLEKGQTVKVKIYKTGTATLVD